MQINYSVSFEFETRPPVTHRGTVKANGEHTCASRAIKAAKVALRPIGWTSLVCVLLDRASGESVKELTPRPADEHLPEKVSA